MKQVERVAHVSRARHTRCRMKWRLIVIEHGPNPLGDPCSIAERLGRQSGQRVEGIRTAWRTTSETR